MGSKPSLRILSLIYYVILISGEFDMCQTFLFLLCITTFISCTITMQVQVSNKNILQRYGHSAAPLAISPECLEVILYGGKREYGGSLIADTIALRFGED